LCAFDKTWFLSRSLLAFITFPKSRQGLRKMHQSI
jgi:hypothetical protein